MDPLEGVLLTVFLVKDLPLLLMGISNVGGISAFGSFAKNGESEEVVAPCYRSPLSEEGEG